ncbi:hypothetical protein GTY65_31225 [Streptomyces sp. SID8379]|uniref:hypothetical protein n=1 Tax=unclassified Streptomyces TaxID=2593676 RepID=UPI0003A10430|nr:MULTISPECIES: hypothetical protein [unclassified Streptomyces]MYW68516.1 hypothetical protein [Streptomyces sp. SID8379]
MTGSARQDPPGVARGSLREVSLRRQRATTYTAVIMVLVSAVLFALIPLAEADNRAYAAAPRCPAGTRADDCRARVPAMVLGTEDEANGRSSAYFLRLTDLKTHSVYRLRMPGKRPLYAVARPADRVTVTYWKTEARQVRLGSLTQDTWRSPLADGRLPGGFALLLLPLGLGLLWLCWWQRYRGRAKEHSWVSAVGIVAGVFVGSTALTLCFAGDLFGGPGVWWIARICALAAVPSILLSALLCWSLMRRMRGVARNVVPVEPDGHRCVLAIVHGDVPYSVPGYPYLVVGAGPPAATPDPTGRFALVPLPPTLTVREVRALDADDPAGWHGNPKDLGIVIDCVDTDGDHRVRIAAGRKTAPLVLGALLEAAAGTVR